MIGFSNSGRGGRSGEVSGGFRVFPVKFPVKFPVNEDGLGSPGLE